MALPRAIWKGLLQLDLVSCAVQLSTVVTEVDKVSFRTLNRRTQNPVKIRWVDSVSGNPAEERVKGFELAKDDFLILEDEEIESARVKADHAISIDSFVARGAVPSFYFDTPYVLLARDSSSAEAFAVIRQGMERSKAAALSRVVLYRRQRPLLIEPFGMGMIATTLRYDNAIIHADEAFDGVEDVKVEKEMIALAGSIIDQKQGEFDPARFEDAYENALVDMIRARQEGVPMAKKRAAVAGRAVDLKEALQRSVVAESGAKRRMPMAGRRNLSMGESKKPERKKAAAVRRGG